MDNSIYNSMIAANQLLDKQNIISNNLANISTIGFKEKFQYALQHENIRDLYNPNKRIIKEYYNLSPGNLNYTERNLDLFVEDNGWIAVKDVNGKEAYTKNGHIQVNSKNKLTIQNNEIISNNLNIIVPNYINLKILQDGTITVQEKHNNNIIDRKIGSLKLVDLSRKDLIQKENGLFYIKQNKNSNQNKTLEHNNKIHLKTGILETSNVNPSKNMIEMISNSRQFDMQMKMISMLDQNYERANQLINVNN